jgi:hypothetical protein
MSRGMGRPRTPAGQGNGTSWFYIEAGGLEVFHDGKFVALLSWRQIRQARVALAQERAARAAEGAER